MTRLRLRSAIGLLLILSGLVFTQTSLAQADPSGNGNPSDITIHVVQPGESLSDIAREYNVTIEALNTANHFTGSSQIAVGQRIIIPKREPAVSLNSVTVGLGDSLEALALQSGTTESQAAELNRIVNPTLIFAGQALSVPIETSSNRSATWDVVRVDNHNSLWDVALKRNITMVELLDANHLSDPFMINLGQLIIAPMDEEAETLLPSPWKSISFHPLPLEVGRSGAVEVETTEPGMITMNFMGKDLNIANDGGKQIALIGVDRWTDAGLYPVVLTFMGADGSKHTFTRNVMVAPGGYSSEVIRLIEGEAALRSDAVAVQQEADYIASLMTGFSPEHRWDSLFLLPTTGVMTSAFGTARSFDGGQTYNTYHSGADFFAKTGTPIYAPADGVVVETGQLVVRGNFTVIDHGWGVYTGYWHQSSILIEEGDSVSAGEQIGLVGRTGSATAAHLHWEMWVGGVPVDPLQWVREEFP